MNIGFIGLGKLGMSCAEVLARKYKVFGYDICLKESRFIHICDSLKTVSENSDVIFVALPTPHEKGYDGSIPSSSLAPKDFDYSYLKACFTELDMYCDENKKIILISTVLPGTIRAELKPIIKRAILIYNPYLIAMGTVQWDMVHPEMIIIGTENGSNEHSELLRSIYDPIMHISVRYVIGTWEEAESIKIFYNTFISAKLSLVNMIQDVAEKLGNTNVDIVCNALKDSTQRITGSAYMKPGLGDGGPCHPRDNIALRFLADRLDLGYDLFGAIMDSREKQAKNMADKLCAFGFPVVILGASYKPGVPYTDGSYSLLVGFYVKQNNTDVYYDEHPDSENQYTYLLAHEHEFAEYKINSGSVVVDPWRSYTNTDPSVKVIQYGNTRF